MTRSTHLVGSWTARSRAMAMDNALERLAPHLQRLSDGETVGRDGPSGRADCTPNTASA